LPKNQPTEATTDHAHRTEIFKLTPESNSALNHLCGETDSHLGLIEKELNIEIQHRSFQFKIIGSEHDVSLGKRVITSYFEKALNGPISMQELSLSLQESKKNDLPNLSLMIKTPKINIKPRGLNQLSYIQNILTHDINFGIGPAGTGKTFLAIAVAVQELEFKRVNKIILVRPAVEAGENLGFLPGDLSQKVDPYLRPMYDALHEMLGPERVNKLIEKQVIEIAPLAFMRGRTLSDAFIILDEAQNATVDQMKMFLTRIGFNSTAVINGDITQVDLPRGKVSGLRHAMQILENVKGINFTFFESKDIVRHPLVQKIVDAYEKHMPRQYDEPY
jgi:phosphate starvation-inducible protein PhoH and related proteins